MLILYLELQQRSRRLSRNFFLSRFVRTTNIKDVRKTSNYRYEIVSRVGRDTKQINISKHILHVKIIFSYFYIRSQCTYVVTLQGVHNSVKTRHRFHYLFPTFVKLLYLFHKQ